MRTIKRILDETIGHSIKSLLSQSSNYQCFLSEKRSDDLRDLSVFYPDASSNLSDAYLLHNKFLVDSHSLKEDTKFNELFDPCNDTYCQKQFFFIRTEIREGNEIYTIGFLNDRARNTINFISKVVDESKFSQEYIHKPFLDTKKNLQEISELIEKEESFKQGVKRFRGFIEQILNVDFSSIRSTALSYHDLTQDIIKKIEESNFLESEKKEMLLENISKFMDKHRKQSILPNKFYLRNKISDLITISNFNYSSVIEILKKEEVVNDSLKITEIANKKFNPDDDNALTNLESQIWQFYELQLESNFSTFSDLINKSDFIHTCFLLSKAQKYIDLENYTEGINYLNRFIESYLNGLITKNGSRERDKKEPIPKRIKIIEGINRNIAEITNSFRKCIKVENNADFFNLTNSSNYYSINIRRNKKLHSEDLGISQDMWNDKFIYLHTTLSNETQSNFLNFWYAKFGLPKKNIFDQINERIIELLDNPDFEPQTPPSTNEQ